MKSHLHRITAASVSASLLLAHPATAQESETPGVQTTIESTTREQAPNTDDCPNALVPPEPTTTSEALAPGMSSPAPLPPAGDTQCGVSAIPGFVVPNEVLASAWIVADLDSGEIIAQKDPHGRYRPASIIKALLALVVIHELDPAKPVTVSHESASQDGSAVGIGEGGVYTVEQLLEGLLLASGNDAAHALAQELGGDEATLRKVNDLAAQLGTTDTRVVTYSGLDAPGMSSSAHDLGLIYRAAFADPTFARIVGTESVDFPGYEDHEGYEVWNDNGLFMNDPDGIGGKTGFTDDAHHTFVGAMDRDGRRLVAILLDTTIDSGRAWEQAQRLLHEAYTHPAGTNVGTLAQPAAATGTAAAPSTEATPVRAGAQENRGIPLLGVGITAVVILLLLAAAALMLRRR